ncbi:hypothetical protein P2H44_15975 [Albimonas sp. CAU 1670]|uniref:hypothetical protein n=1 Tax=Albimonas sp. CAU 1670 TaxID=3032599 RepID=UPI0023DC4532|nr:hypothetical protein [Albimonas sp. CAU 1670]MDF2234059.1 hypothetical protein [Albimonas sp. CAU 1670]
MDPALMRDACARMDGADLLGEGGALGPRTAALTAVLERGGDPVADAALARALGRRLEALAEAGGLHDPARLAAAACAPLPILRGRAVFDSADLPSPSAEARA